MTSKELFEKFVNETENKPYFSTLYDLDMWKEDKGKISKDLEVLDWLIEKMYVAGGLIELKVCPPNNPTILKYHNAIETHDKRFNDYIDRIHQLKYGR